jgi:hypothetical protein
LTTRHYTLWGACLAAWMVVAPAMAAGLDYSPASPDAAQIDAFLTQKHSPLAGIGAVLSGLARDYDVDPRLVVAIAGAETTFGQHQCTVNNAWNWFHRGTCPASAFTSYQEGAGHVTKFLRLSYLNRGYETIEQIRYKYCASGCDNWIPLVTAFYDAMPSNGQPPTAQPPIQPPTTQAPIQSPTQPATQSPTQPQIAQPDPSLSGAPVPNDDRILGLPRYLVFFLGILLVAGWMFSTYRR